MTLDHADQTQHRNWDFAILGAGAMGSVLGAHLARAGHAVVMLARGDRSTQIQTEGLRISGLVDLNETVPVLTNPSELKSAKVLIIAVKALDTAKALKGLGQAKVDTAFSIQNGVLKDELLADAFGAQCVLGAVADISGEMLDSGEVVFTRNADLLLGEQRGEISARAVAIAQTIDAAGVRTSAVSDIRSLEWSKFVGWVGLMVLAVTMRAATWRYLSNPESARVLVRLVREMGTLAHSLSIELTDQSVIPVASICQGTEERAVELVLNVGQKFAQEARQHRMSALQDLDAGRPLEVRETLGYALQQAQQCELSVPALDIACSLVEAIDRLRLR